MQLSVMGTAERHGEFVAHLEAKALGLREPQVVRIGRVTAANEAGLLGDEAQVFAIAASLRLSNAHAPPAGCAIVVRRFRAWRSRFGGLQARESVLERFAKPLGPRTVSVFACRHTWCAERSMSSTLASD
ncbi:hypothetical protein ACRQ5Q_13620 [Bradyrhizobium sp. PMVTL-01]